MKARDIEGNEWNARPLTEEELEKLKERKDDYRRDGTTSMILLDDGRSGIAFPKNLAGSARYYGGLQYDKGEEDVIIDDGDDDNSISINNFDKIVLPNICN